MQQVTQQDILDAIDSMYARTVKPEDYTQDIGMAAYGLVTLDDVQGFHDDMLAKYGVGINTCNHKVSLRIKHIAYFKMGRKISTWSKEFAEDHKEWEYDDDNKCTVCHGRRQPHVQDIPYIRLISERICCDQRMICHTHWTNNSGKTSLVGLSYHCTVCDSSVY